MHMRRDMLIFAAFLLAIAVGFGIVKLQTDDSNRRLIDVTLDNSEGTDEKNDLSIELGITKQWDDSYHDKDGNIIYRVGAQYDAAIYDYSGYRFTDWKAVLILPEDAEIDASWDGIYRMDGRSITVTSMDYNTTLYPDEPVSFGCVLYSKNAMDIVKFRLSGRRVRELTEVPAFRILCLISALWLLSLLIYLVIYIRIRNYQKRQEKDERIILQSFRTFAGMIDAKDEYTNGHSIRVAIISSEIARRLQFSKERVRDVFYIALMHDCGKIGIPDTILNKPDRLTDEECVIVQGHTETGGKILQNFTAIDGIRDGAMYHHERYDGGGYPAGLKGDEIPQYARIICVADSYDAMNSNRCYRRHLTREKIMDELINNSGTQFDPSIVQVMIGMINDGFADRLFV